MIASKLDSELIRSADESANVSIAIGNRQSVSMSVTSTHWLDFGAQSRKLFDEHWPQPVPPVFMALCTCLLNDVLKTTQSKPTTGEIWSAASSRSFLFPTSREAPGNSVVEQWWANGTLFA